MSLQSINLDGGGNAFKFDNVGDSVTGTITAISEVQQTDMQTGQPAFWDGGQPKMMYQVELQTQLRDDPFDEGKRSVYLRGSRKPESKSTLAAVLTAVRAAGAGSNLTVGGTLTLTYVGDGIQEKRGFNPPKQYEASYRPGAVNIDQAAAPAPAPQAPPQQYAPPQSTPQPAAPQPVTPTPLYAQQPPAPQAAPPAATLPAAPAAPQWTPEQIAAAAAAGIPLPGVA